MSGPQANPSDLVSLLNQPGVSHPEAIHDYDCPFWREGKKHGPCVCGARERDTRIRIALLAAGVVTLHESPSQMHERDSLTAAGLMCLEKIRREDGAWLCDGCGWKKVMP